jgi:hypothetical protein
MTPLSPAAQAVLDAVREICPAPADEIATAAILAAADQVVPEECSARFPNDSAWQDGFTDANERIRAKFLAIAAELGGGTTTPTES